MSKRSRKDRGAGSPGRGPGIHAHAHKHEDDVTHVHPHHHRGKTGEIIDPGTRCVPVAHDHGHGLSFERYTWVCSPIHELDPRAKVVAAVAMVLVIVLSPAPRAAELFGLAAFLLGVTAIARVPLWFVLKRSALVLPFAGAIAFLAPLQQSGGSLSVGGLAGAYAHDGWMAGYAILAKAWLSTFTIVVLSATTPIPRLFKGLEALRVPDIILMLLTFIYRYMAVMRAQLVSLRNALDSRGFSLSRSQRVRLYGNLAGNLFIRAYDRGERVHAAMLSRGYTGTLPTAEALRLRPTDVLATATVLLGLAALVLY